MGKFYDDYESDAIEIWDSIEELKRTCKALTIRCAKLESKKK